MDWLMPLPEVSKTSMRGMKTSMRGIKTSMRGKCDGLACANAGGIEDLYERQLCNGLAVAFAGGIEDLHKGQ